MMKSLALLLTLVLFVGVVLISCADDDDDDNNNSGTDDDNDSVDDDDSADDDDADYVVPPADNTPPLWPEWVLRHWVWEDESTQESATDYVNDYLDRDIPVGAVIIDSPWETAYNTFVFDPAAFPEPQVMIDDFHDLDVRVFLWITPNINTDAAIFQEGLDAGYYVENGRTYDWWKGTGVLIDYNNPEGLSWWHSQMDKALDMDIDGWKTDGSEYQAYLWGGVETYTGHISGKEYQNQYYSDFFNYTRERLGNDRVITARPVDSFGVPFWGPNFAPPEVNFAGWVGDQDPTWSGLNAALINMYFSGQRGYVNFGCDIGGYRGDGLREKELFVRWAQLGALVPIMENGGIGEHRPWMYDEEVLDIYRRFVKLHHALLPYLYSQGAESYVSGLSVYRPLVKNNWHHLLGENLLVAPIATAGGEKEVTFPSGDWIDFFTGQTYTGDTTETIVFPLDRYPVYLKKGSILPLDLREDTVFTSFDETAPQLTVLISVSEESSFKLFEENGPGAIISYGNAADGLTITLSATSRHFAFKLIGAQNCAAIYVDPAGPLTEVSDLSTLTATSTGYFYDETGKALWIKPGDADRGLRIMVQ